MTEIYGNIIRPNLELPSGTVTFAFPDVGNMRDQVAGIFSGEIYPLLPLEGYQVEVIVDVGANVGASTVYFAAFNPRARVYSFEPAAENIALLKENVGAISSPVDVFDFGLFDEDGQLPLYKGVTQCMQNSVVPSLETGSETQSIKLRRASSEFDRLGLKDISILKLDTEGCEVPILEDLGDRLEKIDQVYVEYHSEEDRLDIDRILQPWFVLVRANGERVHRGVNFYLSKRLLARYPDMDKWRLSRPAKIGLV